MFDVAQSLGDKFWLPTCIRVAGCRALEDEATCYWCKKFYEQTLSIGMCAEMTRENINLDRLYDEGSWFCMEKYQRQTPKTDVGLMLCQTIRRPANLDNAAKIMAWVVTSRSLVDLVTHIEHDFEQGQIVDI